MANSMDKPELETLDYKPSLGSYDKLGKCMCDRCDPKMTKKEALDKRPSTRVNKADNASQPTEQLKEDKILICSKCDKVFPLYMQAEFAGHIAACSYSKPEKPGVPVLAADVNGKLLKEKELRALDKHIKQNIEQPNPELMIVKSVQGLMSAVSRELDKLNEITSIAERKVLIDQVLEDIDLTEKTTMFELQKAFE